MAAHDPQHHDPSHRLGHPEYPDEVKTHHHVSHGHRHQGGHTHTHGVVDPTIVITARGLWAIKWSFIGLMITALMQVVVVIFSGSVALLADTIHNFGDAVTAIPLGIAFLLARLPPNRRFTYGYGRAEDLAGLAIVGIILFSACVAAYEAIDRLLHPRTIEYLPAVVAASIIGFLGNEAVAVFRIRVGREINSVALIADGHHARVDGWTSLAVLFGALGVWLGFPLADPIVGLLITVAILGIVWQSARAVVSRMLDGVDPAILDELEHAAKHVEGIADVPEVRARWLGHQLIAEVHVSLEDRPGLSSLLARLDKVREEIQEHVPTVTRAVVSISADKGDVSPPHLAGSKV